MKITTTEGGKKTESCRCAFQFFSCVSEWVKQILCVWVWHFTRKIYSHITNTYFFPTHPCHPCHMFIKGEKYLHKSIFFNPQTWHWHCKFRKKNFTFIWWYFFNTVLLKCIVSKDFSWITLLSCENYERKILSLSEWLLHIWMRLQDYYIV